MGDNSGWGVLVLPYTSFVTASSPRDAFGVDYPSMVAVEHRRTNNDFALDISRSLLSVRDSAAVPREVRGPVTPHPVYLNLGALAADPLNITLTGVLGEQDASLHESASEDGDVESDEGMEEDEEEEEEEEEEQEEDGQDDGPFLVDVAAEVDAQSAVGTEDHGSAGEQAVSTELPGVPMLGLVSPELDDSEGADSNPEYFEFALLDQVVEGPPSPFPPPHAMHNHGLWRVTPPEADSLVQTATSRSYTWLDMLYMPHTGWTYAFPSSASHRLSFLRRPYESNRNTTPQDMDKLQELSNRGCLFRTYLRDMELRKISSTGAAIVCRGVTGDAPRSQVFRHTERLSMLHHVPELSLVVAGSATGRVVLLTPTRTCGGHHDLAEGIEGLPSATSSRSAKVSYGFRVDWVLPRASDERTQLKRLRPLYGMAVSPAPDCGNESDNLFLQQPGRGPPRASGSVGRTFRLLLHYRDHTIMNYEIRRDGEGRLEVI